MTVDGASHPNPSGLTGKPAELTESTGLTWSQWLLLIAPLLVFWPCFSLGSGLVLLEHPQVTVFLQQANPLLAFDPRLWTYSLPLPLLSFWIEARLPWVPVGWPGTNLLLHALNGLLLYRLLSFLQLPGKMGVVIVFALHPVAFGAIAWGLGREVLLGFPLLLLICWYTLKPRGDERALFRLLWAGLAAFLCFRGAILLPAIVALLITWRYPVFRFSHYWRVVPLSALGLLLLALKFSLSSPEAHYAAYPVDEELAEMIETGGAASAFLLEALPGAGQLMRYYLSQAWVPIDAHVFGSFEALSVYIPLQLKLIWLGISMGLFLLLLGSIRHHLGRSALLGYGTFFLLLLPYLVLRTTDSGGALVHSPAPLYLALPALFAVLSAGVVTCFEHMKWQFRGLYHWAAGVVIFILAVVSMISSYQVVGHRNYLRFAVNQAPEGSWVIHAGAAAHFLAKGENLLRIEAANLLAEAVSRSDNALIPRVMLAQVQIEDQRYRAARNTLEAVLAIDPQHARGLELLRAVYQAQGRSDLVAALGRQSEQTGGVAPETLEKRWHTALDRGDAATARAIASQYAALEDAPAQDWLEIRLLILEQRNETAIQLLERLLKQTPEDRRAEALLVDLLLRTLDHQRAIELLEEQLQEGRLSPENQAILAGLLVSRPFVPQAEAERAIALAQASVDALGNGDSLLALAAALAATNDFTAAAVRARQAAEHFENAGLSDRAREAQDRALVYASGRRPHAW